jgi:hypothetical protein
MMVASMDKKVTSPKVYLLTKRAAFLPMCPKIFGAGLKRSHSPTSLIYKHPSFGIGGMVLMMYLHHLMAVWVCYTCGIIAIISLDDEASYGYLPPLFRVILCSDSIM